ncbi:glycosyltransferase [Phytohabitans rumicis]|uniref:glycosyltransferase n=1 Tax=Phytohabitans rumicis TaxID=1076125 RepID=UPI0031EC267C
MSRIIATPQVTVVIPTYQRAPMIRRTLAELVRQRIGVDRFEVIVADDGGSDDTLAVVQEFAGSLHIRYIWQEDLGFRAGQARNAGARLAAAPLLVFLDSGTLPGPDFLGRHLAAHERPVRKAVIGYAYGYNPEEPMEGAEGVILSHPPEETVRLFAGNPAFHDRRHAILEPVDFDPERRALPWDLMWTINVSIHAGDFWAAGGFDESFVGWGAEDSELAYRLHSTGLRFTFDRDAWVVEVPHESDWEVQDATYRVNMRQFLAKHRQPMMEIGERLVFHGSGLEWNEHVEDLIAWTGKARETDVAKEVAAAVRDAGPGARIAVFGCGSYSPDTATPAVLCDFDADLLDAALVDGRHTGHHAIGIQTPLADKSVDVVVLTSRLAGLRPRWDEDLLTEAARIGHRIIEASSPAGGIQSGLGAPKTL